MSNHPSPTSPTVAALLAHGVEELELIAPVDALRRGGVAVDLISTEEVLQISSKNEVLIQANKQLSNLSSSNLLEYDLLFVPGGAVGVERLQEKPDVLSLIQTFYQSSKPIAAICAAPSVLLEAGILSSQKLTSHPSVQNLFSTENYLEQNVVLDNSLTPLLTSRGPGTALEFGIEVLRLLKGSESADEIAKQMLY